MAGFWVSRKLDSPQLQLTTGTLLPNPRDIEPFSLVDQTGHPFTRDSLRGAPTLVFFGFTHCPDICPTTLAMLAQVKKAANIPDLRVLFVSVDPERDTTQNVALYVRAFDPQFIGVTGQPEMIAKVTKNFNVVAAKVELPGGTYTVDHSAAVFLLDTQGRIAAIFTPPFNNIERFAEDLRRADKPLRG